MLMVNINIMKKFLIAYYSRTGGTEKMAVRIQNELEKRGHEVKIERIKLEKELSSWILLILDFLIMFQFLFELIVKKESLQRMEIKPLLYPDVSEFDGICVMAPKWGSVPPPICRYLDKVKGMDNKKVGFVGVYYSPPIPYMETGMLFWQFKKMIEKRNGKLKAMLGVTSDFMESGVKSYLGVAWIFNLICYGKPFPKEWKKRSPYFISDKFKAKPPYKNEAIEKFCDKLEA